jgi:hypothetical protein
MNSIMERWIGGCRSERLDRTLIWNLPRLRWILAACEHHHNDLPCPRSAQRIGYGCVPPDG